MRLKNQRDKAYLEVKVQQDSNQLKIHRLLLYLALQNQLEDPYSVDPNLLLIISSLPLLVNHCLDNLTHPNSNQILLKISNFKTNLISPWTCLWVYSKLRHELIRSGNFPWWLSPWLHLILSRRILLMLFQMRIKRLLQKHFQQGLKIRIRFNFKRYLISLRLIELVVTTIG